MDSGRMLSCRFVPTTGTRRCPSWTSRTWPLDTIDPPSPLNDLAGKLPAHPPFSLPRWQLLFLSPRDLSRFLPLFLLLPWTKVVLWIFRPPGNLTPPSPASSATRWDTSRTSARIPEHLPNRPQPGSRQPSRGIPCRSPAPPSNLLPLRQPGLRTTFRRTMTSPCGPPIRRADSLLFLCLMVPRPGLLHSFMVPQSEVFFFTAAQSERFFTGITIPLTRLHVGMAPSPGFFYGGSVRVFYGAQSGCFLRLLGSGRLRLLRVVRGYDTPPPSRGFFSFPLRGFTVAQSERFLSGVTPLRLDISSSRAEPSWAGSYYTPSGVTVVFLFRSWSSGR